MRNATSDDRSMLDRIAEFDWASTPLGARENWPQSLKTAVDIMLGSGHAMQLVWGPERTVLYNDAYAPMLARRHPCALGLPFHEAWPEIWEKIGPLVARVFAGETVSYENLPLTMTRRGYSEETWWSFSYSPVRDESGTVAGLLNVTVDATARVHAEHTEAALRQSEQEYRALFERMGQGYALVELVRDAFGQAIDQCYLHLNPAFERMFGVPASQARGKRASEVFPDLDPRWTQRYAHIVRAGKPERFEHRFNSGGRWFEVHAYPAGHDRFVTLYEDVTERKHAEAVLREREERQAFLLRLSDALRAEPDADAAAHRAIGMLAEQMGLDRCYIAIYRLAEDRADITHQVGNDRVPPMPADIRLSDFPEAFRVTFDQTLVIDDVFGAAGLSHADRCNMDTLGLHALVASTLRTGQKNPSWVMVAVSATPRDWKQGEITLIEDVAERTWEAIERARTAAELQRTQKRWELAVAVGNIGTWEWDSARHRLVADRRLAELFHVDPEAATTAGLSVEAFTAPMHPEERPRVEKLIRDAVSHGGGYQVEHRIMAGDGSVRWVRARGKMEAGLHGQPDRVLGTVIDITENKRTEERQKFLLALSDALRQPPGHDSLAGGVTRMLAQHLGVDRAYLCKASPHEQRVWVGNEYHAPGLVSIAGEYHFDDFPESVRGAPEEPLAIDDLRNDASLSTHDKQLIAAMGMNAVLTGIVRKGGGNRVWALVVAHGSVHAWDEAERVTIEEATERTWSAIERNHMDEALQENQQRLQEANRAKDRFLAMLGHELRNPLAPIVTTLELMKLRAPDTLQRERETIASQTHTLVDMVDDLLDVARIARGDLKLEREALRIADVVDEARETAAWALAERQQTLHVDVEPGLAVHGDRRRLVQVVVNLVVNAAKYSPPDRRIDIHASAADGNAVIRVCDQGHGMAPALRARVFEHFMQAEQSLDRRRGGLGLGLAIVRNIVELHGGRVEAASEGEGKGSEFTVCLPLLHEEEDAPTAARSDAWALPENTATCVLLVDDHVAGAEAMGALLEALGYAVHIEHDGPAALKAAETCDPAIAILDIGLPGMDGYELAGSLRALPGLAELPLIALTGYGQAEDRKRTRAAGFDEHVTKPVPPNGLVPLIRKHVGAGVGSRE